MRMATSSGVGALVKVKRSLQKVPGKHPFTFNRPFIQSLSGDQPWSQNQAPLLNTPNKVFLVWKTGANLHKEI